MRLSLLLFGILLLSNPAFSQASIVSITVNGISEVKGKLKVGLFADEVNFKEKTNPVDSIIIEIKSQSESVKIHNVSNGKYAIAAYHDENEDGVLNKRKLGIPEEGVGISNIDVFRKKPAKFKEAAFFLKSDTTIVISLFYNPKKTK